ncbi:MAG TPA: hypothetical protein VLM17_01310, partial [Xanthomonadaceae bacterium]|nr:hypothetical protein [Xanthomonadaceae bacterium]
MTLRRWLAAVLLATPAWAAAAPATLADCDAAAPSTTLVAEASPATTDAQARAYWLDDGRVQWPAVAAGSSR